MTNEHLSTIELETGFLRRDGNPVAADLIEALAAERDELERLAGKIIEAWQTIEAQCSDGDGFTHKAHADMHDAIDALEAYQRKGE